MPVVLQSGAVLSVNSAFASYQWFLNGTAIPGATNQTYTASANGDYTVLVGTAQGCEGTSVVLTVSNVSIGENRFDTGIRLYPNPARELVTIDENLSSNARNAGQAIILTTTGQLVMRIALGASGVSTLDIRNLAPGLYYVCIIRGGSVAHLRMTVQ